MDAVLVVVGGDEPPEHLAARARRRIDVAEPTDTAELVADLRVAPPPTGRA